MPHHFVTGRKIAFQVDLVVVAALAVEIARVDLAGDQEHGQRVGPGLGHAGQGVGCTWPGRRTDDSRSSRHPRIAVSHERPGLLVAGENSRDPAAAPQGVVNCRRVRPGHAEYVVNAAADEALHQYVGTCSGHLPGAPKKASAIKQSPLP